MSLIKEQTGLTSRMKVKKRKPAGGFTLIEVMVAMAVLAVGIIGVMGMSYAARQNISSGDVVSQAVLLGRSTMEQLQNSPDFSLLASGSNPLNPVDGGGKAGGIYLVSWQVSDPMKKATGLAVVPGDSGSRLLEVEVRWLRSGKGRGGRGSVSFSTVAIGKGV